MNTRQNPELAARHELQRHQDSAMGRRLASIAKPSPVAGFAIGYVLGAYQLISYLYGCGYSPTPIEEVTTEWNPEGDIVTQAFELGIGVVELREPTHQRVLVINDSTYARSPMPLPAGMDVVVEISRPVDLFVTGDPEQAYITCYPVRPL